MPVDGRGAASCMSSIPICRERVTNVELWQNAAVCLFGNQTKLFLSRFLGSRVAVGDEIAFPVPTGNAVGTELLITNNAAPGPNRYLYHSLRLTSTDCGCEPSKHRCLPTQMPAQVRAVYPRWMVPPTPRVGPFVCIVYLSQKAYPGTTVASLETHEQCQLVLGR